MLRSACCGTAARGDTCGGAARPRPAAALRVAAGQHRACCLGAGDGPTEVELRAVDTELRQTHLNALERATIVKTINTAKTLGGPV